MVCKYTTLPALRKWTNYKSSSKWTIFSLAARVFITVTVSWLPWYNMYFSYDEENCPGT